MNIIKNKFDAIVNSHYPYAITKNQRIDGLRYVFNALNYNSKFTKKCTVDCTRNNLLLNYDSGTDNTSFLQIFVQNSTEKKTANVLFSLRAIFDINYDSNTKMCTKDFPRNNLSYFYSATNNTWDSSNQKVKISRATSRKFQGKGAFPCSYYQLKRNKIFLVNV